jgi:chitinase
MDYIWPQYYNTPEHGFCNGQSATSCEVPASKCYRMHFRWWSAIIQKYGKGYCKHVIGLPYGLVASNNGFVPATNLETMLAEMLQAFPETQLVTGGVMGWELASDQAATYANAVRGVMDRLRARGLLGRAPADRQKSSTATC